MQIFLHGKGIRGEPYAPGTYGGFLFQEKMQTAQCSPGTAFYFNGDNVLALLEKIIHLGIAGVSFTMPVIYGR